MQSDLWSSCSRCLRRRAVARTLRRIHLEAQWHREAARTNLWLVPTVGVVIAVGLFSATYVMDRAAYDGGITPPFWVISGTADAARQILTTLAAAVVTVLGVVFSVVIVTLTLASTQFGPRMLRNVIRDRSTQVSLGTFVATFVYAILVLAVIGPGPRGDFVPHVSVTTTLALVVVAVAVLIYFIHHIAVSIQLPQVIADIAADVSRAIRADLSARERAAVERGPSAAELAEWMSSSGGVVPTPRSGYLQFVRHATLVRIASEAGAVIRLGHRPGHFLVQGHPLATVWPAGAAGQVARSLKHTHITGPSRTLAQDIAFGLDQLVEIALRALSPAVNDTFTGLTCVDWIGDSLCKIAVRWRPVPEHRDRDGRIRLLTVPPSYERLVQRSFEKIRQAGHGMPAVMIRQLDALAKIMEQAPDPSWRQVLLEQAAMIQRAADTSVSDPADLADVLRRYEGLLDLYARRDGQPVRCAE